jgi:hypothetical protein
MKLVTAIISLLAVIPVAGAAGSSALLDQLQADQTALRNAEHDFRQRSASGELAGSAAADYSAYLQALRDRVSADCRALLELGSVLPADAACTAVTTGKLQLEPLEQALPRSRAERISILDAQLEAGLGEFDQLLLREQERVRASAPSSASGAAAAGAAASDADGGRGAGHEGTAGAEPGASEQRPGEAQQPGQKTAGQKPGAGRGGKDAAPPGGAEGQPPGIPDGSDDDVVARQLREAAEQETDPELRKKLWEEYRNYKEGIS